MPLNASQVGRIGPGVAQTVDARWLMAYAASFGDMSDAFMDTQRGVVAHPLFPVCIEWPCLLDRSGGDNGLTTDEARRGVHATHDLMIHRVIRPGERLVTRKTVVGVERRASGALQMLRFDTVDAAARPVATTYMGLVLRDVALDGEGRWDKRPPPVPPPAAPLQDDVHVLRIPANAAHLYTEGSRIWNPIHTDREAALEAGLPGIIFHGTGLLAMAVSRLMAAGGRSDPARVRRIVCRFAGMTPMPTELDLRISAADDSGIWFAATDRAGKACLKDGYIGFGSVGEAP